MPDPVGDGLAPVSTVVQGRAHAVAAAGATVPADTLWEVARDADVGARAVDAFWGTDWTRSVTVVVGRSGDLGTAAGHALPAAAVTVPGAAADGVGTSHVVVDSAVWSTLSPVGRQVVITHELVHVATGSVHDSLPRWLEEGVADQVGWSGAGVPVGTAAREELDDVTTRGVPDGLPTDAAFDLGAPGAAAAYGQAYVAAWLLARSYGQDGLADVYRRAQAAAVSSTPTRAVSPDQAVDEALRAVTGEGLDAFVAAWRAELRRLAAATA